MNTLIDHEIVLQGFTASLNSTEDPDVIRVDLYEDGNQVYETEVPVDIETEDGTSLYTDDVLNYVAQAAIDLFEAERGTLGQGAGVMAMKKKSGLWELQDLEDWFLKFKGTGFEDQAASLLEQKLGIQLERSLSGNPNADLYQERAQIEHEMAMLNLERLRESENKTIIIIQGRAKIKSYYDGQTSMIEDYLNKFIGDKRENQALKLVQEYLDVDKQINGAEAGNDDFYDRENEIDNLMEDLSIQLLQQNVMEVAPDEGAEALPNMASDMAELMEGVSLDVPFGEMSAKVAAEEEKEKKEEPEDLGEKRDDLDPAEVPEEERMVWNDGQHVKLKREVVQNLMGGMKKKYPKGTKVIIDSLYDRHGDYYLVREEATSKLFRVKWSDLTK